MLSASLALASELPKIVVPASRAIAIEVALISSRVCLKFIAAALVFIDVLCVHHCRMGAIGVKPHTFAIDTGPDSF